MEGETTIQQSDNGVLTLTDRRVFYNAETMGESSYISIPLDQVAHCALVTSENIWQAIAGYLMLAAAAAMATLGQRTGGVALGVAALGFILVMFYHFSKKQRLSIVSTAGGEISVEASTKRAETIGFLEAVEAQRQR